MTALPWKHSLRVAAQVRWGKVVVGGGRSDSLRTDKLQGRKRGREQEREEEGEVGICLSQGGVSLFLLCSELPAAGVFFFLSASLTISLPAACWKTLAVFWLPDLILAWTEQLYTET